jgi:hypothetical protein
MLRPITVAFSLLLLVGCGGGDPPLVPVSGIVTLNGKPFPQAGILFVPDPGNPWITEGRATTDLDGKFQVLNGNRAGLTPGKYQVTISDKAATSTVSDSEGVGDDPFMKEAMEQAREEGRRRPAPRAASKKAEPLRETFGTEIIADRKTYEYDVKRVR